MNANRYNSLQQLIADAIKASILEDRTVTIEPGATDVESIEEALFAECEGDVDDDGQVGHEFWGRDIDGNEWRVGVEVGER